MCCAGLAMFRCLARHAGYPLHSPLVPSLHLPRIAVCHVILIVPYYWSCCVFLSICGCLINLLVMTFGRGSLSRKVGGPQRRSGPSLKNTKIS
jgi:hypothetical protein